MAPALRRSAQLSVVALGTTSPEKRRRVSAHGARRVSTAAAAAAAGGALEFGVDEAGRGPLAGPVVSAACYLPDGVVVDGVKDSKELKTEALREEVYSRLVATPGVRWSVAVRDARAIDDVNILEATLAAMREATYALCALGDVDDTEDDATGGGREAPDRRHFVALVDGNQNPWKKRRATAEHLGLEARTEIKGDGRIHCISAASVIAKVTRDRLMVEADARYPQYGFAKHKGYGVRAHMAAIAEHGFCDLHRTSFEPIKSMVANGARPVDNNGDDHATDPLVETGAINAQDSPAVDDGAVEKKKKKKKRKEPARSKKPAAAADKNSTARHSTTATTKTKKKPMKK